MDKNLKNILLINTGGGIGDTLAFLPTINYINTYYNPEKIYYYSTLENFWFENKLNEYKPNNLIEIKTFPNHFGFIKKHFFTSKDLIKKFEFDKFDLVIDNQTRFINSIIYKRIPHRYYITPCLNYFMSRPFKFLKKRKHFAVRIVDYLNKMNGTNNKPIYNINIPKIFSKEAKKLIPNNNYIGFSITTANPYRVKSFNLDEIIKVANFFSKKFIPTFFIEKKHSELISYLKNKVNNFYLPEEKAMLELQKPILVTALGSLTKFNISINNGISHMLSFSQNKNFIFFNEQAEKWKPDNNQTQIYDCKKNNVTIDRLTSNEIISFIESN